jgi:SnoaL-like domain
MGADWKKQAMSITRRIFLSSSTLALSAGGLALSAQVGSQPERKQKMPNSISTLLKRNLTDVFGESDPVRRRAAIEEIFAEDAVFYDPNKNVYRGRAEIDRIAGALREMHRDFTYQPVAEPEEVGNGGRIRWVEGRPGEAPEIAGTDFIIARDGRIAAVYLFFDKLK